MSHLLDPPHSQIPHPTIKTFIRNNFRHMLFTSMLLHTIRSRWIYTTLDRTWNLYILCIYRGHTTEPRRKHLPTSHGISFAGEARIAGRLARRNHSQLFHVCTLNFWYISIQTLPWPAGLSWAVLRCETGENTVREEHWSTSYSLNARFLFWLVSCLLVIVLVGFYVLVWILNNTANTTSYGAVFRFYTEWEPALEEAKLSSWEEAFPSHQHGASICKPAVSRLS